MHGELCVIYVTNQCGVNGACFDYYALIPIIWSILCGKFLHMLCWMQIAYVWSFHFIESLIIEHKIIMAT